MSESSTPSAEDAAKEIAIRLRQTGKRFCADIDSECCIQCREVLVIYTEEITAKLSPHFAELAKLQKFKDYVHKRLDDAGIPTHPDGPHAAEGCRVGERLDVVFAELAALRRERDERWAVVEKFLKTNDGATMYPGMKVYPNGMPDVELTVNAIYGDEVLCSGDKRVIVQGSDMFDALDLFSTRAALAAAQKGVTG